MKDFFFSREKGGRQIKPYYLLSLAKTNGDKLCTYFTNPGFQFTCPMIGLVMGGRGRDVDIVQNRTFLSAIPRGNATLNTKFSKYAEWNTVYHSICFIFISLTLIVQNYYPTLTFCHC